MSSKSKEVEVKKAGAVAQSFDYGDYGGQGFEDVSGSDLSMPFISVLQPMSPQVEEIEGAKAGMLFNTVTKEVIEGDKGIVFQPCFEDVKYLEWIPRESGGGLAGIHAPSAPIVLEAIKRNNGSKINLTSPAGNELQETHHVYGFVLDEDGKTSQGFAVIPFTSSKIKPKRDWFTALYMIKGNPRPPLFASRARLRTTKVKNEKGTFYNFSISPFFGSWVDSLINPATEAELLSEGAAFRTMISQATDKVDYSKSRTEGETEEAPF